MSLESYYPQIDYGGGTPGISSWNQNELEGVYGQSMDDTALHKASFKQFVEDTRQTQERFKLRVGIMEVQADRLKEDLKNAPSVVQHTIQQALDANLKQQTALAATLTGPVSRINEMLMNKTADQAHAIASSSTGKALQERIMNNALYYQELDKNNKNIIAALGGMSQLNMRGMEISASLASNGLTTALSAASSMARNRLSRAQQEIQANELDLRWKTAKLESETNLYAQNMGYKGGIENAMIRADSANYNTWLSSRVQAYGDYNRTRASIYSTQLKGFVDNYDTNIRSRDDLFVHRNTMAQRAIEMNEETQRRSRANLTDVLRTSNTSSANLVGQLLQQGYSLENAEAIAAQRASNNFTQMATTLGLLGMGKSKDKDKVET